MAQFAYKALNHEGQVTTGVVEAPSREQVAKKLLNMQLTPLSIDKSSRIVKKMSMSRNVKIKTHALIIFTRQMRLLLKAGVPLLECLKSLGAQVTNENWKKVLDSIGKDVEFGISFSQSLKKYPKIFSDLYVNSVQVGEISGTLEGILQNLEKSLEEEMKLMDNIKKATRMPMIVFVAIIIAVIVFITYVIPKFTPIFEMSGQDLPIPTRIIMGISDAFTSYWYLILGIAGGAFFSLTAFYKTKKGKYIIQNFLINMPIYGELLQKISVQRFSTTLALLSRSGIPLVEAIDTARRNETNSVYERAIAQMRELVEKGQTIANAMKRFKLFPPIMINMVFIGEKSGALDEMLENVADFNSYEIERTVQNLTSLIEPVVTVFLGIMVLILALSIFLPMWNMLSIM
jgi:type II secretory pathway component PulF